jgi:predicted double-glycine peptidase
MNFLKDHARRLARGAAILACASIAADISPLAGAGNCVALVAEGTPKGEHRVRVIRQTSSATCGQAALATLFTFYFHDPVTEAEMTKWVRPRAQDVSTMRELRDACRARGYDAAGVKGTLSELVRQIESSGVPVLVHFKEPTQHYLLVLGRVGDRLLVADPAKGETTMHETDFLRRWDNVALVIKSPRPADGSLIEHRKRSAETRLQTLHRAGSLMSATRY